jgi:uncharacterized membrane protein
MKRIFKVIRNHVITGFIFLMPVLITLAVISKFWTHLLKAGNRVSKLIHVHTLLGPNGDAIMALILFIVLCVLAGFLVKMTVFKKMSDWLDNKLTGFIPGYSAMRKDTEIKIGHGPQEEVFETCLVRSHDQWIPAYLISRADNGDATVFVPLAPSYNSGQVMVTPSGTYRKLEIDSSKLNEYLKKRGKGFIIGS